MSLFSRLNPLARSLFLFVPLISIPVSPPFAGACARVVFCVRSDGVNGDDMCSITTPCRRQWHGL